VRTLHVIYSGMSNFILSFFVRQNGLTRLSRDDTRLTGQAHELLGKHVAQMLRNHTAAEPISLED